MGQVIAICKINPYLYKLNETIASTQYTLAILTTTTLNNVYLWNLRLGHINQRLSQLQAISKGIKHFDERQITLC